MKFARYLEETQVPEWKRAYIDYRGLKKRITAIKDQIAARRQSRDGKNGRWNIKRVSLSAETTPGALGRDDKQRPPTLGTETSTRVEAVTPVPRGPTFFRASRVMVIEKNANPCRNSVHRCAGGPSGSHGVTFLPSMKSTSDLEINKLPNDGQASVSGPDQFGSPPVSSHGRRRSIKVDVIPVTHKRTRMLSSSGPFRKRASSIAPSVRVPTTLAEVLEIMSPLEVQFFEAMDKELEKVEAFYREREKDALVRSALIKVQLNELEDHGKVFRARRTGVTVPKAIEKLASHLSPPSFGGKAYEVGANNGLAAPDNIPPTSRLEPTGQPSSPSKFEPEEYRNAKKQLKRAVLEFYRGVEYLHNYRILNLTGFRKALKKFEKVTQIKVTQLYHNEKIEPSILSNSKAIDDVFDKVETLYAARFEGGDHKKAKSRLRASFKPSSHHPSTFRTGIFIGLSLPAIIFGIYRARQPLVQTTVAGWSGLLQIYLAFFIPVAFGLLVSLNNIVWARVRINYIFIFELDARTVVDCRESAELPALLLMTLSYAFCFSFLGLDLGVSPSNWPLIWLGLAAFILINPLPIFYPYSRRWILRKTGGLFLSGFRKVEFQDFYLGDQYCSLAYTLSSLYFMGCTYKSSFKISWGTCDPPLWEFPWMLSSLPSFIRLVQCIRRYFDSGQYSHLVNGGKYGSSVLYYALYYNWRNAGSPRDNSFVVWVFFACITSCYTTSWDFLMDWSLFQRGSKYPLLRKELLFENHIWAYYFAIVTNTVIRFGWVFFAPIPGPDANVRHGIQATLEALRRFQWNFFRLENEHIGNADQYRVTREMPLPYAVDHAELSDDGDDGDEDDSAGLKKSTFRASLRRSLMIRRMSHDWQAPAYVVPEL